MMFLVSRTTWRTLCEPKSTQKDISYKNKDNNTKEVLYLHSVSPLQTCHVEEVHSMDLCNNITAAYLHKIRC